MRVTVITPSKNQGKYIDHCLRSVNQQTHREIEHLVMDGMSGDATAEIVARYPNQFFRWIDSGPAQAINRALEMASGDIVCWLNADDAYASNTTLERVVTIFTKFPAVDVITGNGYYIDEEGRYMDPIVVPQPDRLSLPWLKRSDIVLQPATFWRRNGYRLNERLQYGFDWRLWLDFLAGGLKLMYVPEYFALYRIQADSLTQQDSARRREEIYRIVQENGHSNTQAAWCWLVWRMYGLAERGHCLHVKTAAKRANSLMARLTGGRIVSC
jgi:glycosyltransferase involved in cell wall biosynthesis